MFMQLTWLYGCKTFEQLISFFIQKLMQMIKREMQKNLICMKILLLLVITFPILSCDRKFYHGSIVVERHVWELKRIDTFFFKGKFRPSAVWYNRHNRLNYVDSNHEFPYPYVIGARILNFDRK